MRLTAAEKREVIRLVEESDLPVRRTLCDLRVHAVPKPLEAQKLVAELPVERFVKAGERLRCSRGRSFTRRATAHGFTERSMMQRQPKDLIATMAWALGMSDSGMVHSRRHG